MKSLTIDVGHRKMGQIQILHRPFGGKRGYILRWDTPSKERQFKTERPAVLGLQMPRVVPPLSPIGRMRAVVPGEDVLVARRRWLEWG